MRIISGSHKGKRLTAPRKLPVRPTTDFAKEGLFNILRNQYEFDQLKVLDLFSGTGNISYEFASRGSSAITAVDAHIGCIRYIKSVTQQLDMAIDTVQSDVFKFLERATGAYDIIFADPPYDFSKDQLKKIVDLCAKAKLLTEGGCLIIEHSKHLDLADLEHFNSARKYGGSVFSFFGEE
jgi:16S rRNA (guanine(966)-N(2))-methyltransferase RsmD